MRNRPNRHWHGKIIDSKISTRILKPKLLSLNKLHASDSLRAEPSAGLSEALGALHSCAPIGKVPRFLRETIAPRILRVHRPGIAATPPAVPGGREVFEKRAFQFPSRRVPTNSKASRLLSELSREG